LPAASAEDLRVIAERLRKSIEDNALSDDSKVVRVTVSIGGAAYPNQNVDNVDLLIQIADEALFEAKGSGRNRTVLVQ
jgi:diguanylate cyclase (GGDEF)-like protein